MQPCPNAFEMRKYFSGNYVFPSPKSSEDQKKRSSPKIKEFLTPKSSEEQKKYIYRNLGLNSAGNCGICSCCLGLFYLFNQRSNLDGGTRPPSNLSTGSSYTIIIDCTRNFTQCHSKTKLCLNQTNCLESYWTNAERYNKTFNIKAICVSKTSSVLKQVNSDSDVEKNILSPSRKGKRRRNPTL